MASNPVVRQGWQAVVDLLLSMGVDPADIPTGTITASTAGDSVVFKSKYVG